MEIYFAGLFTIMFGLVVLTFGIVAFNKIWFVVSGKKTEEQRLHREWQEYKKQQREELRHMNLYGKA